MILETLSTGDEILRGRSLDTNAPWIAARAAAEGVLRSRHGAVGDDLGELAGAFREACSRAQLVVVTGGLGPTGDDLSREAAALAAGVDLVCDPDLLRRIREAFEKRRRTMHDSNRKMALIPEGAVPLPNPLGTAPGFRIRIGRGELFCLSGVPREMEVMFEAHVLPAIRTGRGEGVSGAFRSVLSFGRAEAWAWEALGDLPSEEGLSVGITADLGVIRVTIQTVGADADARADDAEARVRRALGPVVLEAESLPASVGLLLERRGLTLGLAESCTGGLVGKLLTDMPGSSGWFAGSLVTYANRAKTDLLGVPEEMLEAHGAVSEPVARAMAEGARRALHTDLAVSVTGIAGPGGGSPEKPVGLVHFALAAPDGTEAISRRFMEDRASVRGFAAHVALGLARRWLRNP